MGEHFGKAGFELVGESHQAICVGSRCPLGAWLIVPAFTQGLTLASILSPLGGWCPSFFLAGVVPRKPRFTNANCKTARHYQITQLPIPTGQSLPIQYRSIQSLLPHPRSTGPRTFSAAIAGWRDTLLACSLDIVWPFHRKRCSSPFLLVAIPLPGKPLPPEPRSPL